MLGSLTGVISISGVLCLARLVPLRPASLERSGTADALCFREGDRVEDFLVFRNSL